MAKLLRSKPKPDGILSRLTNLVTAGCLLMGGTALLMSAPVSAWAQGDPTTATLSGTVTDSSGAVVPSATVTLSSPERGIERKVETDGSGHYQFQFLPPSEYSLQIQGQGYKTYLQKGLTLRASESSRQNVPLTLGDVREEVNVTSEAPLLNTEDPNVSAAIGAKQVVELPLNLRNVYGLATLNSSVNITGETQARDGGGAGNNGNADQDISFLNFGGGFFGTSAFLLDGVWDTGADWGAVIYTPSVDSVEEFKIQSNSFTAQYGWSTGNVIDVVTKSGTSKFHGSAYEFYRNSVLDANLYFANRNGQHRPDFTRNQLGVSASGPLYIPGIYKQTQKTFIFGLYERLSASTPAFGTFTVPTASYLAGNFSSLLGGQVGTDDLGRPVYSGEVYNPRSARLVTNGQVDARTGRIATVPGGGSAYVRDPVPGNNLAGYTTLDPTALKILSYYPSPTNPSASNNFTGSAAAPFNSNEYMVRIDHNISDATRFFARYAYKQEQKVNTPTYFGANDPGGPGNIRPNNRYTLAAGYTHVFTPTLTLNAVAGFQHWAEVSHNQAAGFTPSTLGLPSYLDTTSRIFPNVNLGSESQLGPSNGGETVYARPAGSFTISMVKLLGHHALDFGFTGVDLQFNAPTVQISTLTSNGGFTAGPDPDNPTANTGNGVAELLFGVLDGGTTGIVYSPAVTKRFLGGYVQDDWKATNQLTLNLGIRYEVQTAPTYRHNSAGYFVPNAVNPLSAQIGSTVLGAYQFVSDSHRGVYDTNFTNVAPRIGFAYHPFQNFVLRGGFGYFYPQSVSSGTSSTDGFSTSTTTVAALPGDRNPNSAVTLNNPFPQGLTQVTGNSLGALQDVGLGISTTFQNRKSTEVVQDFLGVQEQFTPNDVLSVSYVGNHGLHLTGPGLNRSQLDPKYLSLGTTYLNAAVPNPYYGLITASNCSLNQPTVARSQLLQPYSQYCGVTETNAPYGSSNYNALQASYDHRFKNGVNIYASYTFSKFLDNTPGTNSWSNTNGAGPANTYDLASEYAVDSNDVPHSLVVNYVYELPVGRGKTVGKSMSHATDAVLGGWQISGISSFKSGLPIGVHGSNINSYGGTPRPDQIANPTTVAKRTVDHWFNTGAFAYAAYGTFGDTPRNYSWLRGPGYQNWDVALMKNWSLPGETRLQFRAEMYNAFNHPQFYNPNTNFNGCDPNGISGATCVSSFGKITATYPGRDVQFAGKYYW
jgi:hypothetical protein